MMDENEIYKKAAESFTEKPTLEVEVNIEPENRWHKLLMLLRIKPKTIKYTLRPTLVGNRVRIASRALLFPKEAFKSGNVLNELWELSIDNNEDLIYIAAVALQNDRNEPSEFLLKELKWVDDKVLFGILDKSLSQIDLQSFMKSTILIVGTEMMKPKNEMGQVTGEIIASGEE